MPVSVLCSHKRVEIYRTWSLPTEMQQSAWYAGFPSRETLLTTSYAYTGINLGGAHGKLGIKGSSLILPSSFLIHQFFHIFQKSSSNALWARVRWSKYNFILRNFPRPLQTKHRHYYLMKSSIDLRNEQSDPVCYVTQVFTDPKWWRTT